MKTRSNLKQVISSLAVLLLLSGLRADAQICSSPSTLIYGLSNGGFLFPLNINTGVSGSQINPAYTGNAPQSSNGAGYSQLNGKFYYFKRSPGSLPQEFVSYDPVMNKVTLLDTCPTNNAVYVGSVNHTGTAYYCWDAQARLFYYNIATNKWILITTAIVDQTGADVDAVLRAHGSGDAAFDGSGNLLMLPASTSKYALYRMSAPLPTTPVASITVTRMIALSSPPPSAKFVGIALNPTGQILLNTASPNNKLYRLENNFSLTFLTDMDRDVGDLTSCNFPLVVLPLMVKDFAVTQKSGHASLTWQLSETVYSGYSIEHSIDGKQWQEIYIVNEKTLAAAAYNYLHTNPSVGNNLYRVRFFSARSGDTYSAVKSVAFRSEIAFATWPNPVKEKLYISNSDNKQPAARVIISDFMGNIIRTVEMQNGVNAIDMKSFSAGCYILRVQTTAGTSFVQKVIKK
jgi:hypothetical protein